MAASVMAASIAAARPPRKRLRHAADCGGPRRLLWARSMTHAAPAPAPETLRVQKTRIACDGTGEGLADAALGPPRGWRSEERRGGKEWVSHVRLRGWPYHYKKKQTKEQETN